MLGQTIARHFAKVFLSSVCTLIDSILYLLRKNYFRLQLVADFANESSGADQFSKPVYHVPWIVYHVPRILKLLQRMLNGKSERIEAEIFSPGKKTVVVKTAMKD